MAVLERFGSARIYESSGGRPGFRVRWTDPITGGRKEKSCPTITSARKMAASIAGQIESVPDAGLAISSGDNLEALALAWWSAHKHRWAESYQKDVLGQLKNHIIPNIGMIPLANLKLNDGVQIINQMIEEGYSRGTVNIVAKTIKALTLWGVGDTSWPELKVSPFQNLKVAKSPDESDHLDATGRTPTKEQATELLKALPERWRLLAEVCMYSGTRFSEAAALRDPKYGPGNWIEKRGKFYVLNIDWQQDERGKDNNHLKRPKKSKVRVTIIPEELVKKLKKAGTNKEGWYFRSDDGAGIMTRSNWSERIWQPAVAQTQNTKHPWTVDSGAHGLRHRYASTMLELKYPTPDVSKSLGHASPYLTATIYGQADEDYLDRLSDPPPD